MLMKGGTFIRIASSEFVSKTPGSVRDRSRILSSASDALDINSLKKICKK